MLFRYVHHAKRLVLAVLLTEAAFGQAPPFSSGSTGADGQLNLTTPGVVYFDPKSFNPPLDPEGDNVFHFTTINIGAGVTLKLSSKLLSGPVYFLATGAVQISGTIDLNGEPGHIESQDPNLRVPAAGGAGGYAGGVGGRINTPFLPTAGDGPGGGAAGTQSNPSGSGGTFSSNLYLTPLIGGSGGGGYLNPNSNLSSGSGGGGGGGAIVIASSVSITVNGPEGITAQGGAGQVSDTYFRSPTGSGGAIRLVAPAIVCTGSNFHLRAHGSAGGLAALFGIVRLEGFSIGNCGSTPAPFRSEPTKLVLPATPPHSIRVTSINGIPINANPFTFPDAVINSSTPVTINIQAQYIPPGTVPKVFVFSETGQQTITATALQGTLQSSTATASITFPTGGSRGYVKATW